jgi:hypothetical protein
MKTEYKYYLIIAGITILAAVGNNLRLEEWARLEWFSSQDVWEKPE